MTESAKVIDALIQWNMNCADMDYNSGHEAGAWSHRATAAMLYDLRAENARLRAALKRIAILGKPLKSENWSTGNEDGADAEALTRDFGFDAGIKACAEMAREALAGEVKP